MSNTKRWGNPRPHKPHYKLSSKEPEKGDKVVVNNRHPGGREVGELLIYERVDSNLSQYPHEAIKPNGNGSPLHRNEFLVLRD